MKLTFSNIAWDKTLNTQMIDYLKNKTDIIEIAPKTISDQTYDVIYEYQKLNQELKINTIQSIFFGVEHIGLQNKNDYEHTIKELKKIYSWCDLLNIKYIVFGNPRLKYYENDEQRNIIDQFFAQNELILNNFNVKLLIEANPQDYGANYLTNHKEVINYVKEHNFQNVLTMIDLSTIMLNKENLNFLNHSCMDVIKHVHLSAPFLELNENNEEFFKLTHEIIQKLNKLNYNENISIEMKNVDNSFEKLVNIYEKINNEF